MLVSQPAAPPSRAAESKRHGFGLHPKPNLLRTASTRPSLRNPRAAGIFAPSSQARAPVSSGGAGASRSSSTPRVLLSVLSSIPPCKKKGAWHPQRRAKHCVRRAPPRCVTRSQCGPAVRCSAAVCTSKDVEGLTTNLSSPACRGMGGAPGRVTYSVVARQVSARESRLQRLVRLGHHRARGWVACQ